MNAVVTRAGDSVAPPSWAQVAVLHVHCMAPWWLQIHGRPRRARVRHVGNVAFLPPPIAGYRIRHHAGGSVVEIKPGRAAAIELGRYESARAARLALQVLADIHARPFLGEIGERAA